MSDLVKGNISTLVAAAAELQPIMQRVDGTVDTINRSVQRIRDDAGWSGDAADAFELHWEVGSLAAGVIGLFTEVTADVLAELAADLTDTEERFRAAIAEYRGMGVAIGDDGNIGASPGVVADDAAWHDYPVVRQLFLDRADDFRLGANNVLVETMEVASELLTEPEPGLSGDDRVELLDYLRGFLFFPVEVKEYLTKRVAQAKADGKVAKDDWKAARDARNGIAAEIKNANTQAGRSLRLLAERTGVALQKKTPIRDVFKTNLGTLLSRISPRIGALLKGREGGVLKFLADVPVIDLVLAGVATGYQVSDDVEKGMSSGRALAEDSASNAAGVGAGLLVGGGVAVGLGTVGFAPVAAVGIGMAVGGAVAIGVGDVVYEAFHEDWAEDIHRDGALGIVYGTGHVFAKAGDDLVEMAEGIGDLGKSVWHSLFG